MLSILPRNTLKGRFSLKELLIQPARYAWELALPRRLLTRPPVLSTCWLIRREALEKAGGFEAVSRKAVPESYFARFTSKVEDGYSFQRAGSEMGLTSLKGFAEQLETSKRMRYPQLHRRPEMVVLVSLAELAVLVAPLLVLISALITGHWLLALLSVTNYAINSVVYSRMVNLTYRQFVPSGIWFLPVAALYDIGLLNYSMWLYEFRQVIWKGRNICLPVMRAYPNSGK
jgi:hypothetical protein